MVKNYSIRCAAGEFLFQEGDADSALFLLETGEIEILSRGPGGHYQRLALLGPGAVCDGGTILGDDSRTTAARALADSRLVRLDRETLLGLLRESPESALRMLQQLARRGRQAQDRVLELEHPLKSAEAARSSTRRTRPGREPAPLPKSAKAAKSTRSAKGTKAAKRTKAAKLGVPRLVCVQGEREFLLAASGITHIGRPDPASKFQPDIDLQGVDENRSLSRRHARISQENGKTLLHEEQGSANGTYVNRRRLKPSDVVEIHDGDHLRFGQVETIFRDSP